MILALCSTLLIMLALILLSLTRRKVQAQVAALGAIREEAEARLDRINLLPRMARPGAHPRYCDNCISM